MKNLFQVEDHREDALHIVVDAPALPVRGVVPVVERRVDDRVGLWSTLFVYL